MIKKESKKAHHTQEAHHEHHNHPRDEHKIHHQHHVQQQHHSIGTPIEHEVLKNLVEIQKVHVDLAEKFDNLAKQISSLLALFEVTAKRFATQVPLGEYEKDKEFLDKIDKLLDQNKTLAKGLTLMEERLRERVYGGSFSQQPQLQISQPQFPPLRQASPQMLQQPSQNKTQEIKEIFQPSMNNSEESSFPESSQKRPLPHF